ncbi:hypothetical protein J2W96_007737 [Variovorax guangxiensis]|nr:hypothetical protein [Variovorax guangxiensis]
MTASKGRDPQFDRKFWAPLHGLVAANFNSLLVPHALLHAPHKLKQPGTEILIKLLLRR